MSLLSAITGLVGNLLAFLTGRQQAQRDNEQRKAGQESQQKTDLKAALQAEQKMGQALADAPKNQKELDDQLKQGKF